MNTWDVILTSVSGNIEAIGLEDRRVNGLSFDPQSGAFRGIPDTESGQFTVTFGHDAAHPQVITLNLGTVGSFGGLTQFAGTSTAVAREQDGYESGKLSAVSVNNDGTLVGAFTNGAKKDLATLQIALFNNPAALQNTGGGLLSALRELRRGHRHAGDERRCRRDPRQRLEKSNADVATEFVNMIEAQNGYQANARTIRVATDILRELTNLIR